MAKFADIGLPPEALPMVLEVLHNDVEPRAIAAAAASRGTAAPNAQIVAALITALRNLRGRDESVELATREITTRARGTTTATLEILAALRWQPAADGRTADALTRSSPWFVDGLVC
jgi:hypothetical protein